MCLHTTVNRYWWSLSNLYVDRNHPSSELQILCDWGQNAKDFLRLPHLKPVKEEKNYSTLIRIGTCKGLHCICSVPGTISFCVTIWRWVKEKLSKRTRHWFHAQLFCTRGKVDGRVCTGFRCTGLTYLVRIQGRGKCLSTGSYSKVYLWFQRRYLLGGMTWDWEVNLEILTVGGDITVIFLWYIPSASGFPLNASELKFN